MERGLSLDMRRGIKGIQGLQQGQKLSVDQCLILLKMTKTDMEQGGYSLEHLRTMVQMKALAAAEQDEEDQLRRMGIGIE